jgi:predicted metal-dependent hydrolase
MKKSLGDSKSFSRTIRVNGSNLPYRVERRSVKYPRLEFKTAELLVILPRSVKNEAHLLEKKINWIARKHEEIQRAIAKIKIQMKNGRGLFVMGDLFEFHENVALKVDFAARVIECDPSDKAHIRRLERILKRKLLSELEPAVEEYSKKLCVKFNRITVRKQRSKWGSCSSNGNLSFNFWLICLPRELIRYVACHEVAHLREKGHGRAFWELASREFENCREMEKKLFDYWFFVQEYSRSMFSADVIRNRRRETPPLQREG